jgi:hypothetical protein
MPKNTDPDFNDRLATFLAGNGDGTETTEIDGELNGEGGQKVMHHFKSKKVFVRGRAGQRFIVPDEQGKQIVENWTPTLPGQAQANN